MFAVHIRARVILFIYFFGGDVVFSPLTSWECDIEVIAQTWNG